MVLALAFITMFIDHLGFFIYTDQEIYRIIGRIAFPLFARGITRGYSLTSNKEKYLKRLFFLGIITQFILFSIGQTFFNVCFTLSLGLLSLMIIDDKVLSKYVKIIIIGIILVASEYLSRYYFLDYGGYGILIILLFNYVKNRHLVLLLFFILTFLFYDVKYPDLDLKFSLQAFSILAPIILYYTPILKYDFKLNRYFKYFFYPGQFIVIYILSFYLK